MVASAKIIAELLSVDNILLDVDVSTKEQVFATAEQLLRNRPGLAEFPFSASLQAREALGSTALGLGVAVPHARMRGLAQAQAVFMRLRTAIPFDAPDGKPVANIVVIFVPEQATQTHLRMLAGVAELFHDRRFREQLAGCLDAASVSRLFVEWST